MAPHAELTLLPSRLTGKMIHLEGQLRTGGKSSIRLWYRIPAEYKDGLTDRADPFVIGFLFPAMQTGRPVLVRGTVSPSLLRNLEEFMAVWQAWRPDRYRQVEIIPDQEEEAVEGPGNGEAVMPFSGGVDSCFTAWRHRKALAGRRSTNLTAGVFIHGFDIPLRNNRSFILFQRRKEKLLGSIGMTLIPLATNFRDLPVSWADSHAAALVSSLTLFGKRFSQIVVASSEPYVSFVTGKIWGSNPLTDRLLSSGTLKVIYDGAEYSRIEKIQSMSDWPEALRFLRVCWEGKEKHENCCRCVKCIRNILIFRALGKGLPPCFPRDASDDDIRKLSIKGTFSQAVFSATIETALKNGYGRTAWISAMREAMGRKSRARGLREAAKNLLFRRNPMSRHLRTLIHMAHGRRDNSRINDCPPATGEGSP